ncbi:MAG TPA: AI-2E family transporter [Polyangiaceae bacterium]|jgi:predicted PurR-regulated permease PerM|nr:AI-2E family transporter [Polyangiaceae bacterium]
MSDSGAPTDEQQRIRKLVLIVLVSSVSLLFLWMIRGFLLALLLASLVAGMLYSPYKRLATRLGGRRNLAAGTVVGLLVVLVVGPLVGLGVLTSVQAVELAKEAEPWLQRVLAGGSLIHRFVEHFPRFKVLEQYQEPIMARLSELGGELGTLAVGVFTTAASETLSFFLLAFVLLYATFYFLLNGRATLRTILYYSPLPQEDEDRIVGRFLSVARATLKGTLVVGIVQGALGGLGFAIAGIGGAVFWGVSMTVLSVVPSFGTAIVWVPAVGYLLAMGRTVAAVLLLLWCSLGVGTIDNFLRPALVGKDTKMPDLLILLSTLGGIVLFGIVGFIVGPLIASMFVTVWEIYGEAFRDVLPEPAPLSTPTVPPPPPQDLPPRKKA